MKSTFKITTDNGTEISYGVNRFPDGQIQFYYGGEFPCHLECSIFDSEGLDLFTQMIYTIDFSSVTIKYFYGARCDKDHYDTSYCANLPVILSAIIEGSLSKPDTTDYKIWNPHCKLAFPFENVIPLPDDIESNIDRYDGVIYPDNSAFDRMGWLFPTLPAIICKKKRYQATGDIANHSIPYLSTALYLVVDDLCDGGATFISVAKAAGSNAALDLYITHGLFSKGLDELRKYYRAIWATDSCPGNETVKGWKH
jgi:hypothetical protein